MAGPETNTRLRLHAGKAGAANLASHVAHSWKQRQGARSQQSNFGSKSRASLMIEAGGVSASEAGVSELLTQQVR